MIAKVVVCAALGALLAAGCGGKEPTSGAAISAARYALRKAEEDGAAQAAPVVMRAAHEKLDDATALRDDKQDEPARRLAEEVTIEAQLADAMARNARVKKRLANIEEGGS